MQERPGSQRPSPRRGSGLGRRTFAAALAALALVGAACGGKPQPAPSPTSPSPARSPGVLLEVTRDARPGTEVFMAIQFVTAAPVTLEFNSGQRFDFVVARCAGEKIWQYSNERSFAQVLGREELKAGEGRRYEAPWTPQSSGAYVVEGRIVATNVPIAARKSLVVAAPGEPKPAPCA